MGKVGVGARDHETEVTFAWVRGERDADGYRTSSRRFRVRCSCGYIGPDRSVKLAAEEDEFAHMTTEEAA